MLESFPTVAVKVVAFRAEIAPTGIKPEAGVMETVIARIVIPVPPVLVASEIEVATMLMTVLLETGVFGAV